MERGEGGEARARALAMGRSRSNAARELSGNLSGNRTGEETITKGKVAENCSRKKYPFQPETKRRKGTKRPGEKTG